MRKRKHNRPNLPQRPRQHELDTEAVEFIRSKLPIRWTRQETLQDYGIDLMVEIFEDGEATGLKFDIQSKGHEHFIIRNVDQISQTLKVSTLNYYEKLLHPVLLVVYSAQDKQACYLWIKQYIHQVLDLAKPGWQSLDGNSEITIHVPRSQILEGKSSKDILNYLEAEYSRLRIQGGEAIGFEIHDIQLPKSFAVSTRLIRPKITQYLHRPHLIEKLSSDLLQRSIFIRANAGYGKTWLLQEFIEVSGSLKTVWYTFSKDAVDSILFIKELASEFARQTTEIGKETLYYLQTKGKKATLEEASAILLDEVSKAQSTRIVLILEDLHYVNDDTILTCIAVFLASFPDNLRIILTSRSPLPFGQTKLIAQSRLIIIEQSDLEFTLDETIKIVNEVKNLDLSPENVKFLNERTGGWIAAVSLALDALSKDLNVNDELFNRLTGYKGNIYDFFAEEVYSGLAEDIRFILKRLSISRRLQPEIVNLFSNRTDGGQVLKDIVRCNTFLVENQNEGEEYRLHTLFAEFLETRFRDEEGVDTVRQAHRKLANYFMLQKEWFSAAEHATDAEEWQIAVQSLEIIGPVGVSSGYGQLLQTWIKKIPQEWRDRSALLCELEGLSAFQIGDLDVAAQAFSRAKELYTLQQETQAEYRLEYYSAEIKLEKGISSLEEFLRIANKVSKWNYQHNEIFFGSQVELRLIQVGQTITLKYHNLFQELIERGEALIDRIEPLGSEYDLIRAKVLASQAHLIFQGVTLAFETEAGKVNLREKLGHPVSMDERKAHVKFVLDGIHQVWALYDKAQNIAKEKNEIEWAVIRSSHLTDYAHHLGQIYLMGLVRADTVSSQVLEVDDKTKTQVSGILAEFDHCAQIFGKYHQMFALAKLLCDAADVYDFIGDIKNRDRLAKEAHEIGSTSGFADLKERAANLLQNQNTITTIREKAAQGINDKELAEMDEKTKAKYVDTITRSFIGDADIDKMRNAIASDVDDMISSAKQRLEWCRHLEIIQDLQHTKSLETMYREIPKKRIVCKKLSYRSPNPGQSFEKLWPMFKGVFCLGCLYRNLNS